jgi:acyl-CoA thioester hydrolase, YbgC/YbaW family
MKFRIYYDDTDAQGIVYHANFLKFCERARSEIFFANGVIFEPNSNFVVSKITANFIKPAFLGDTIDVKTSLKTLKKASVILEQSIFKDETLIFKAEISVAFLKDKKITKIDEKMVEIMQNFGEI